MKRFLPLFLALVMLCALAACSKDKPTTPDPNKVTTEFKDPTFAPTCEEEAADISKRLENLGFENMLAEKPEKTDVIMSNYSVTLYQYTSQSGGIRLGLYETKNTSKMCLISLSTYDDKMTDDDRKLRDSLAGVLLDTVNNGESVEGLLRNIDWANIFNKDSEETLLTYGESKAVSAQVQYHQGELTLIVRPKAV